MAPRCPVLRGRPLSPDPATGEHRGRQRSTSLSVELGAGGRDSYYRGLSQCEGRSGGVTVARPVSPRVIPPTSLRTMAHPAPRVVPALPRQDDPRLGGVGDGATVPDPTVGAAGATVPAAPPPGQGRTRTAMVRAEAREMRRYIDELHCRVGAPPQVILDPAQLLRAAHAPFVNSHIHPGPTRDGVLYDEKGKGDGKGKNTGDNKGRATRARTARVRARSRARTRARASRSTTTASGRVHCSRPSRWAATH